MHTGFLFGAGFSKGLHEEMLLTTQLLNRMESQKVVPQYVPDSIRNDLEQLLSYLWTNYPWFSDIEYLQNRSNYISLTQKIHELLVDAEVKSWEGLTKDYNEFSDYHPAYLQNAVKNIGWQADFAGILANDTRFVTVTMNYDTLLERLMIAKTNRTLIYYAPLQPLERIWEQEDPFYYKQSPSDIAMNGYNGYIHPRLFKLHGSLSWYSLDPIDVSSVIYGVSMNRYYAGSKQQLPHTVYDGTLSSVIVPPVSDKSSLYSNKVLRAQWIGAYNALSECDELYCVGYSFPKTDLSMQLFLTQATTNLHKVYIVNPSFDNDLPQRLKTIFPKGVKFEHIGGQECVQEMAKDIIGRYGEKTQTEM